MYSSISSCNPEFYEFLNGLAPEVCSLNEFMSPYVLSLTMVSFTACTGWQLTFLVCLVQIAAFLLSEMLLLPAALAR